MPLNVHVALISGERRTSLDGTELNQPTVVPAQHLTVEIEGAELPATVHLDGRELPLVRNDTNTRGFIMLDTAGSVGFHCLRIGDADWYFATEDAKLKLNGILQILAFIEAEGLAWAGQLFFANGSAIRHPKIDYAWLESMAPRIVALAGAIAARPLRRPQLVRYRRVPGAGKLFLKETLSLLRKNPLTLLEENEQGVITEGDRRFFPQVVVAGQLDRSFDVIGNRRMTHLLLLTVELCRSLQSEPRLPKQVRSALRELWDELRNCLELFPFAQLRSKPATLPSRPVSEEIVDERYRQAFDIYVDLANEMAWEPGLQIAERSAYVEFADQIYQAFVAVALARAFEAKQVYSSLWPELAAPVFRSDTHDIYYDTVPPTPAFMNWRDASNRPSAQRPDLTIIDRRAHRGILADAKYRVEPGGRLPTSGIHDAQVYLQSFERKSIAICYPGKEPLINRVTAKGYLILEVSVGPFRNLEAYIRDDVRPAIEAAMEPLNG